jgi:rfaE bifunctional protein nucleotidyltransferase chain/domain
MILVYAPGCFDLLHIGHLEILERARALGDRLIVGVPSDAVVAEDKGENPVIPLEHRIRMLAGLKCVDAAVPYYKLSFRTHIAMFRPDIFVVGGDWGSSDRHIEAENLINDIGGKVISLPYSREESTTRIKQRIRS